jgi:hypothetical protein
MNRTWKLAAMVAVGSVALAGCLFPGVHQVTPKLMRDTASPGLWHTFGGTDCVFKRLSDFSGDAHGTIASFTSPGGPRYVEIKSTDAGFDSQNCVAWVQADGPFDKLFPATDHGQFSQGDYRVGKEVQTGTYLATVTDGCRWQRLSGFGGEDADVIESGTDNPVAAIGPDDVGFRTWGCGVWTRVSSVLPTTTTTTTTTSP